MASWVATTPESNSDEEIQPLSGVSEKTRSRCTISPEVMKHSRVGCFVLLGVACLYIWLFTNISDSTKEFLGWTKEHRLLGVLLLTISIILVSVIMLPVTPLILGAGFSLGVVYGQIAVSLGCTLGAQAAFLVARRLLRDWVEEMVLPRFPVLSSLDGVIQQKKHSLKVCLLLRMCPILPFSMLNYSLGSTGMGWKDHILGTWVGMFPEQLMIVFLGSQLRDVNAVVSGEADMMKHGGGSSVGTWIVLVVLVAFTILGTIYSQKELREIALQYGMDQNSLNSKSLDIDEPSLNEMDTE
eukprot:TRINITY_DN2326_c0_g1_i1.p1 TRINITY_DN2326_c0_g1~~TRINITY_DN2326_c0_g1_i1.p1  ORF type:complete len:298 (-),score=55.02 TRINITY_DN2326_c0_g1_i1:150-1043(-)